VTPFVSLSLFRGEEAGLWKKARAGGPFRAAVLSGSQSRRR
jgi:hypothetical protein